MKRGEELCEAARKVRALIDSGADVSHFDGDGLTPLMYAAKHGYSPILTLLLSAGAPWNALSPSNLSAGDFAMQEGHQEAYELLLNTGIQAELILGTIARKENENAYSSLDYFEDRVSFSEDKLMDSESKAVMMAWEKPLMETRAKAVCSGGGHYSILDLEWVSWIRPFSSMHLCHTPLLRLIQRFINVCFVTDGVRRKM